MPRKSKPFHTHSLNDRILRADELCQRYGVKYGTLMQWQRLGRIPHSFKLVKGGRAVGWYASAILAHEAKQAA
jgi:predicted DNA-binding transcriptional regulator AlpA